MNENCTVIINSCDKYEEVWNPFFSLFKIYWPDCKFHIILNTETKQYNMEGLGIRCINSHEAYASWGWRMKNVLKQVNTKYVIMLLEDFFLQDYVDSNEIDLCIERMESNENIVVFYYKKITGFSKLSAEYPDYFEMDENKKYKLNLQAGLWNRKALIEYLDDNESPWAFEELGQERCTDTNHKFYCTRKGSYYTYNEDTFPYLWAFDTGYGICKSQWLWNNKKLFERNGIEYRTENMTNFRKSSYLLQKYYDKIMSKIKDIIKII